MTQDENYTLFENQLPSRLNAELKLADNLGIKPVKVGNIGFDEAINRLTDILHLLNKGRVGTAHLTKS